MTKNLTKMRETKAGFLVPIGRTLCKAEIRLHIEKWDWRLKDWSLTNQNKKELKFFVLIGEISIFNLQSQSSMHSLIAVPQIWTLSFADYVYTIYSHYFIYAFLS